MQNWSTAILLATLLPILFSCGSKENTDPTTPPYVEPAKPSEPVITSDATEITVNSALLYGSVYLSFDDIPSEGEVGFIVSTSSSPSLENGKTYKASQIGSNGKFRAAASDLSSSTVYYYMAFIRTNTSFLVGRVKQFKTKEINASVTTEPTTEPDVQKATLNGILKCEYDESVLKSAWFYLSDVESTAEDLKAKSPRRNASLAPDGTFTSTISGLTPETLYYYVACARVGDVEFYGEVKSFTTQSVSVTVTTRNATNITPFTSDLNGQIAFNAENQVNDTKGWFLYSATASTIDALKKSGIKVFGNSINNGSFSYTVTALSSATKYYYVAVGSVLGKEFYGEVMSFSTKNESEIGEAVDLGLSVKWRSCNIGASSTKDYGGYFAWGEITQKDIYDFSSYLWRSNSGSGYSRYNSSDGRFLLEETDDVASVKLGSDWWIPTFDEWVELRDKCQWRWTSVNGTWGYKITSKVAGYTNNSIFLPAAGYWNGAAPSGNGIGFYWSSNLDTNSANGAWSYYFNSTNPIWFSSSRHIGMSIRPVRP